MMNTLLALPPVMNSSNLLEAIAGNRCLWLINQSFDNEHTARLTARYELLKPLGSGD